MIQKRAQFNIKRIYSSIKNTEKKFNKVDEWSIPRDRFSFYLTHDFHPYFAAFPPELVKRLLDRYSKEGDVFLDPFMGGGSAIVEGFRLKRRVMGVEISPFAKFISEVKVTPIKINKKKNSNLLSQIKNDVSKQRFNSYRDFDYKIPEVTNIDKWFIEKSKFDLAIILYHIKRIKSKHLRNFLLLALSSIIRKVSNAKNSEQHLCIKKEKKIPETFSLFEKKVELMISQMEDYIKFLDNFKKPFFEPKLYVDDVRKLTEFVNPESVDIIITSPPYGTGSRYTDIYRFNFEWLGFKKPTKEGALETTKNFTLELKRGLQEMFEVLRKKKYCFIVYGNPSTENSITKQAIYDAQEIGFKYKGLISCPIEKTLSNHHTKYRRFIPRDFILIFKKP